MPFYCVSFILIAFLFSALFVKLTRILILKCFIICCFLRNHPRLSSSGTGRLFWVQDFLLKIIGLASAKIFSENFKYDILWLYVLRGIKARDSLTRWGYISNPQCSFCCRRETIDHCFLNCSRVKCVWSYFYPLLSPILGKQFTSNSPVVFFFCWRVISAKRSAIARYIIKTIIYGV